MSATIFLRVHKTWWREQDVLPGAFKDRPEGDSDGMSVNWDAYISAEKTRLQPSPERALVQGVVRLNVGQVADMFGHETQHNPQPGNYAHALVIGEKNSDEEVRTDYARLANASPRIHWTDPVTGAD